MRWKVSTCLTIALVTATVALAVDRAALVVDEVTVDTPQVHPIIKDGEAAGPAPLDCDDGEACDLSSTTSEPTTTETATPTTTTAERDSSASDSCESTDGSECEPSGDSEPPAVEPSGSRSSFSDIVPGRVQTESGTYQGQSNPGNPEHWSYFDIPYGVIPDLFKAPRKAEQLNNLHDVKEHTKRCPQIEEPDTYVGDLDCLTLSIFKQDDAENAPVLFHIHDGNFISGSGDPSVYGPDLLVSKGVIVVLPNYRLGPLGFLCLHNEFAPGNAALKDLTLALEWTTNNIEEFGGNASNIVVSGDGSSGALVGYLALSPKSSDYISGAITESGSVLAHWAIDRSPVESVTRTANMMRIDLTDHAEAIKSIDVRSVVRLGKDMRFRPCVESGDEWFMNDTVWNMLQETEVTIPFMIGAANHAGMHEAVAHSAESIAQLNQNFSILMPNDLQFEKVRDLSRASDRMKALYFGDANVTLNNVQNLSLWYTDAWYLGPAIRSARPLVKAGAPVYFYEFSFVGELNREHDALGEPFQGAARGDIVGYIFVQDEDPSRMESDEEKMVELMTNLWVSFIKTGKPSSPDVTWNELKEADGEDSVEEWLSIDSADPKIEQGLHLARLQVWTEMYQDHFVDNLAFELKSSYYVVFLTTIVLLASIVRS